MTSIGDDELVRRLHRCGDDACDDAFRGEAKFFYASADRLSSLLRERDRMKNALEFYAQVWPARVEGFIRYRDTPSDLWFDAGKRARAALEQEKDCIHDMLATE